VQAVIHPAEKKKEKIAMVVKKPLPSFFGLGKKRGRKETTYSRTKGGRRAFTQKEKEKVPVRSV